MKWRHCDCRAQLKPHTLEHVHSCSSFSICCCSNDICRQPNLNTQINTSTQNAQFSLHRCLEFMHSKTYQCYQVLEWAMTAQFSQQMVCICVGKQTDLKWKLDTHQRAIFVLQMLLSRHSQWPSAYYATVFFAHRHAVSFADHWLMNAMWHSKCPWSITPDTGYAS